MTSFHNRRWLVILSIALAFPVLTLGIKRFDEGFHARIPPRGWNSYDSFSWTINEEQFLDNAKAVFFKLKQHGYQYVVVDYLWYRKLETGANTNSFGFDVIDPWGRPVPDPVRWPSSRNGNGFKIVAELVHKMGLKFGIHVMRGISIQAYDANTPIMGENGQPYQEGGKVWRARDIGLRNQACKWMDQGFMSVDTKLGASKAFLKSLYNQYADWGVDFVKHDCVFGDDLNLDEITSVSEILKEIKRPVLYSISPGTNVTVVMAREVHPLVNMYRITGDDWDNWKDIKFHFRISSEIAKHNLIGATGLSGKSWPDMDMLPFGHLSSVGSNQGPYRTSSLTYEEKKAQMTLWAMTKSPLMFGGDLRNIDEESLQIITNPTLLNINAHSSHNMEFPSIRAGPTDIGKRKAMYMFPNSCEKDNLLCQVKIGKSVKTVKAWIAKNPKSGDIYLAYFNLAIREALVSSKIEDIGKLMNFQPFRQENGGINQSYSDKKICKHSEIWSGQYLGLLNDEISIKVPRHGCKLIMIQCS